VRSSERPAPARAERARRCIAIFILFWTVAEPFRTWQAMATVLYQGATIGLMAVSVSLLMIGASSTVVRVAVVTAAMVTSILVVTVVSISFGGHRACALRQHPHRVFNGWLVTKTGIPSFLITLSALFMLFGITSASQSSPRRRSPHRMSHPLPDST